MAQRPDLEMIRRYVKAQKRWNFGDEAFTKWAMSLPFFYMANKNLLDQPHGSAGPYPDQDLLGVEHVYNDYVMAQTFDAEVYQTKDDKHLTPKFIKQKMILLLQARTLTPHIVLQKLSSGEC